MSKPLYILYAAAVRLPTEKAHGVQIVRTCEALAKGGSRVELAVPGRQTDIQEDTFSYYRAAAIFNIVPLKVRDWFAAGQAGFFISSVLFGIKVARYAAKEKPEIIYSRDKLVLLTLSFVLPKQKLVWELHGKESASAVKRLGKKVQFITITQGIKDELVAGGVAAERIAVAADGVDLALFMHAGSKEAARARLDIAQDKTIAMYIGRLDGWKGVDVLCEAAALLPQSIEVVIVGGEKAQVGKFAHTYPRVRFLGFKPYADIANNEAAADVLVLPNTAKDITSQKYTSPLKLFTYMASGKPMIVSDLPSIREVVDEESCYLVTPDNPQALADGIQRALEEPQAVQKATRAYQLVNQYTWDARAEKILAHINA